MGMQVDQPRGHILPAGIDLRRGRIGLGHVDRGDLSGGEGERADPVEALCGVEQMAVSDDKVVMHLIPRGALGKKARFGADGQCAAQGRVVRRHASREAQAFGSAAVILDAIVVAHDID
ncbi:hypothetical protein D3C72_1964780 [compost metagenome]